MEEAIDALASGKKPEAVADFFNGRFPFRMREVEFLISQHYTYEIDWASNIIHWIHP
jgi:hypothetical protein